MKFFTTEPVSVILVEQVLDDLGEVVQQRETMQTVDALVCPTTSSDLAAERPNGDKVDFRVHFKRDFDACLRGAFVEVRGLRCRVLGDPVRLTDGNTPTDFNLSANVEVCRG